MPVSQVETPNGVIDVEHPEGTPQSQIIEFAAESLGIQPSAPTTPTAPEEQPLDVANFPLASEKNMDNFSAMEKFTYEFAKAGSLTGNLAALGASVLPSWGGMFVGGGQYGLYASPEEIFGADYGDMTVDQRREKMLEFKDNLLREDFPRLHQLAEEGESTGGYGVAGAFFKSIADPSIALPTGQTIKAITALGALYGGAYEASRGLLEDGEIDAAMTAATAVGGGILGGGIAAAVRKVAPLYNSVKANKDKPKPWKDVNTANETAEQLNSEMLLIQAEGGLEPDANILVAAAERLQMPAKTLKKTIENKTIPLEVHDQEIAKAVEGFRRQTTLGRLVSQTRGTAADLLAPIDDRIGAISRPVLKAVNEYEMGILQRTSRYQDSIAGFDKLEKALPTDDLKLQFEESLLNYEMNTALPRQILKQNGVETISLNRLGTQARTVDEIFDSIDSTLKEIGEEWSELKNGEITLRDLFFPRSVADHEGLLAYYGKTGSKELDKMYDIKAKSLGMSSRSDLSQEELRKVALDYIEGVRYEAAGKAGQKNVRQFKQRKIEQVGKGLMPYYAKSSETLGRYMSEMAENIENARLWKRLDSKVDDLDNINSSESIAQLIAKKTANKELTSEEAEQLKSLLEARFVSGKKSMHKGLQDLRNISNIVLLANFRSATTQLGDLFTNPYRYGAKESFKAMFQVATGKTDIDVDKLGIAKIISTELTGAGTTAKWLDKAFALSFFRGIDRLGKNVSLQAAFNKHRTLAKTEKGIRELKEEYGDYLGTRMDSYIRDLQDGVMTQDAMLVNFTEIVKMQPLTPLQKSKVALMNPNYGIFYMLKTYALRHLSMVKNDITKELDKGNYLGAGKKFLAYSMIVGGGNATIKEVKNWEDGKGFDVDRVPDHFVDSMLNLALTSRYATENAVRTGDWVGLATEAAAPPLSAFSNISKDIMALNKASIEGDVSMKWVRNVPIAGRTMYNLFFGGSEDFLEREAKERAKD
jgi:hypothetical protein